LENSCDENASDNSIYARHSGGALDKDLPMLVIFTFLWSVFIGLDLVFSI